MAGAASAAAIKDSTFASNTSGRKARGVPKTRVQFDLSPRAFDRLTNLKEKTESVSYAEVVKSALRLYDGLIEETERGSEFLVRDKDGNVTPFRMWL